MAIPFPNDRFTYNGGRYRPVLDESGAWTPVPMSGNFGEWSHTRRLGNFFDGDGKNLHTVWTVRIQIFSMDDFRKIRSGLHRFADLTAPPEVFSGTRSARLLNWSNMRYHADKSYWLGEVSWEYR